MSQEGADDACPYLAFPAAELAHGDVPLRLRALPVQHHCAVPLLGDELVDEADSLATERGRGGGGRTV